MSRSMPVILLICALLMPGVTCPAQTFDDMVTGTIRDKLGETPVPIELHMDGCRVSSLSVMPELYARRDYRPIWVDEGIIEHLCFAIEETYHEGLDPDDYHLGDIRRLQGLAHRESAPDPRLAAYLDMLLTDAFVRLIYHSFCGKEDPFAHHPQWNLARKIDDTEPVVFIENAIASSSIAETISAVKIRHPYYESLKKALAEYRALRASGGWETVPEGQPLKKGMIDPRVASVRRRLVMTERLPDAAVDPMTFDGALEQAVIGFQRRHGLKPDGVVGKGTLLALNVPVGDRIDQIRVNLERARWMLHDLEERFVLVDIAGFRVFYSRDSKVTWSSRAQVGQPYRDTPVFRSSIQYIEFNPSWVVPPGIFQKDILPAVVKDPGYLRKKDLSVIDNRGKVVDPKTISWSRYANRPFPYRLRQEPGENSALGRIKIFFPNEYLVYLHDTPSKALFEEEERAFSSGCIRVEKPYELTELLLDDPGRWSLENIIMSAESGKNQRVPLPRPVTILLLYWTVEVDEAGIVHFKRDPYNRDGPVLEGLGRDAGIRPAGMQVNLRQGSQ
jgi:murein L,D-transpeptidase YcbB/YkuD